MAPAKKAPAIRAPRAVGVKRASQRKGWVPPTADELAEQRAQRDRDLAEYRQHAETRKQLAPLHRLGLQAIPGSMVGQPTRIDPHGTTAGGGYWIAELAKTGRKVQAVTFDTKTGQLLPDEIYPCKCDESRARSYGKGCSRKWCECSGRVILPNSPEDRQLPDDCCARGTNSVETLRYEQDELEIAKRSLIAQNKAKGAYDAKREQTPKTNPEHDSGVPESEVRTADSGDSGRKGMEPRGQEQIRGEHGHSEDSGNNAARSQPDRIAAKEDTDGQDGRQGEWGAEYTNHSDGDIWQAGEVDPQGVEADPWQASEYGTYLDRLESRSEALEDAKRAELAEEYTDALAKAKARIAADTCACPTPWDGEARNASTGLHCVECHENFQTIMAYDMHRKGIWDPCIDPSEIINRKEWGGSGKPLMRLGAKNGKPIWAMTKA